MRVVVIVLLAMFGLVLLACVGLISILRFAVGGGSYAAPETPGFDDLNGRRDDTTSSAMSRQGQ